jgi:predicted ATPase/DNA-binding SARP family transcriptional activator
MARLLICLLGPLQVTLDGKPVTGFESDKVRALLAYLAAEADRPHRREKLAGLLWPGWPERSARTNLRHALFNLRTAIGDRVPSGNTGASPPFLHISPQTIQFNVDSDARVDLLAFKDRLGSSPPASADPETMHHLEEAVALYRGPFLEGFSLADSAAFEEWMLLEGERVHRLVVEALHRLGEWQAGQGQAEQALQYAWRQVELDPWRESGHQQVMRLLAASGKRSEALAQYETCRRHLAEELAVEPSTETTTLYERIRDGTHESQLQVPAPMRALQHNLPVHLTPFVGREAELAQIRERLRDPTCRLLTLAGPGGIGKTRLALEAAASCVQEYDNGVFQVRLAGVRSAEAIVPALAQAIGFSFYEGGQPRQQLVRYLRQKRMLLVVDNYEHLLDGIDVVADILRAAPGVTMLITSRIKLNLSGENLLPVAGLAYPKGEGPEPMPAGQYDAVTLFLAGARRVYPGFDLEGQEWQVGRICRLVEGMPLALLLAAAWVEMLPPAEIADSIEQGLDFLESGWQDVPERHRSIRAVFDRSWGLLGEHEKSVFQALSVFCDGFTGQAARRVAGATLPDLRALVNRSLLHRAPSGRYKVHELLRQYAAEKLARSPSLAEAVHDGHSAYYVAAVQLWAKDLQGSRQMAALAEMDVEIDNARAAWDWAVARGQASWLEQALDGLAGYYDWRVRYGEGETALQAAVDRLQAASGDDLRLQARVLAWQGLITWKSGRPELANQRLEQSLALLEDPLLDGQDTRLERAFALFCQGYAVHDVDREASKPFCEQSVALYEALGDRYGMARALKILGEVISQLGAFAEGRRLVESGLAHARAVGDQRTVAECLQWLSLVAFFQGQAEEAARFSRESADIYRALGARAELAYSLTILTGSFLLQGQFAEARSQALVAVLAYEEMGLRHAYSAMARGWLGIVTWLAGDYEQARQEMQSTLAMARETDWKRGEGGCLLGLGGISLVEGAPEQALKLLEESAASSQAIKQIDDYAWALANMGYAECALGRIDLARDHLFEALRLGSELEAVLPLAFALPGIALLWASCGQTERAVELYALASGMPIPSNSPWFEDAAGKQIAAAAATLPPDTVAAAEARGRARDLKSTIAELVADLGEEDDNPCQVLTAPPSAPRWSPKSRR